MNNIILETIHLSKTFKGNSVALVDVNLQIKEGKIIGLLGPNGSGKTTLIKIINNLINNYEGEVLIYGNKPGIESKKVISYLPDVTYLDDKWNAEETISYFKDFYEDFEEEKVRSLLATLNIPTKKKFKELSKGTKEKLQLVFVLSRKAKLYIFDEPIAGVDPAARDYIFKLITENYNPGSSILFSTHLISEAEKILDEIIFLKNGHVELFGEAEEIRQKEGKTIDELFREVFRC